MKKLFFVFIALFAIGSCQKALVTEQRNNTTASFAITNDVIRSINDFYEDITPNTKSYHRQPKILSISQIGKPSVKSSEYDNLPSYLVNFTNDDGFAIVAITGNGPCVLAFTESGNLDGSKLFNSAEHFDCEEEQFYYSFLENLLATSQLEQAICKQPPITKAQEEVNVWYTDSIVYPLVHIKWGQEYPFNMSMPTVPSTLNGFGPTSPYRCRHAVGCVIIAAMQIAVATEHPYSFTVNNQSIDSYLFSDISFYGNYSQYDFDNYDSSVSDYMKAKTENLADLLYQFGVMIGATPQSNGMTSAYSINAMNYLDYLDHTRYGSMDLVDCPNGIYAYRPAIFAALDEGKPLIVDGWDQIFPNYYVGHTWVIDGYMAQHKTGNDNDIYVRKLVHFNWGWHGKYDGYYHNSAVGDRDYVDSSFDPDPTPASSIYTFNFNTQCYTY